MVAPTHAIRFVFLFFDGNFFDGLNSVPCCEARCAHVKKWPIRMQTYKIKATRIDRLEISLWQDDTRKRELTLLISMLKLKSQ